MKNIIMMLTLACAALLLTQCKKGIVEQPNVTPCSETIEVSLNADNGCSKATISGNTISWEAGDRLYVVGETDGYLGYISAQNSGTTAYFTGTINKGTTAQYFHYYFFGGKTVAEVEANLNNSYYYTYDITNQTGSITDIADDLLLMHGKSSETIASGQTNLNNITMRSMISIVKLQFGVASGTLGNKVMCTGGYSGVKFNVKTGSLNTDNTSTYRRYKKSVYLNDVSSDPYYMVVLPGNQTLEFSQGLIGLSCSCPEGGFQANMLYNESNPKSIVLGEMTYLPAIFTVNNGADGEQGTDDDTQVKFSKGNLQYLGTGTSGNLTPKWRFAEHQWDYMGDGPSSGTKHHGNVTVDGYSSYNTGSGNTGGAETDADKKAARDLFGWGTSGLTGNLTSHAVCTEPFSTNGTHANYLAYGGVNNHFHDDPDGYYPGRADWGSNMVYCSSLETMSWRTLSGAEMAYLINNDRVEESTAAIKTKLTLEDNSTVYGLIIVPDEFDGSPALSATTTWDNWQTLSSKGAAFLPAAGSRYVGNVTVYESPNANYGRYWNSSTTATNKASNLNFNSTAFNGDNSDGKATGYAVRLVRNVVDANGNANPFGPEPWE